MSSVLLLGYNRPENILQRVAEISANKPKHLYISIDKSDDKKINDEMLNAINLATRLYFDSAKLTVNLQTERLGLARHVTDAINQVLKIEKNIVVIEDDIRISQNFVAELDGGYNKFKKDFNLVTIGGFSGFPVISGVNRNYWRKTTVFSAWGWMVDRETWSKFQLQLPSGELEDHLRSSRSWATLTTTQKSTWINRFEKVRVNPNLTWDFQMQFATYKHDLIHFLPLFRICENTGFNDSRSTNTRNPKPRWMQSDIISTDLFHGRIHPIAERFISKNVDSFTISGDSRARKSANLVRRCARRKMNS